MGLLQEIRVLDDLLELASKEGFSEELLNEKDSWAREQAGRIKDIGRAELTSRRNKKEEKRQEQASAQAMAWEEAKAKEWDVYDAAESGLPDSRFRDKLKKEYITKVREVSEDDKEAYAKAEKVVDMMFDEHDTATPGESDTLKQMVGEIESKGRVQPQETDAGKGEDEGGYFGPGWGSWRPGQGMDISTLKVPDDWEEDLDKRFDAIMARRIKRQLSQEEEKGTIDLPGPEGEPGGEGEGEGEADESLHIDTAKQFAQAGLGATIDKVAEKVKQITPMKRMNKVEKDLENFVPRLKKTIEDFIDKSTRPAVSATARGMAPDVGTASTGKFKLTEVLNNVETRTFAQKVLVETLKEYNEILLGRGERF